MEKITEREWERRVGLIERFKSIARELEDYLKAKFPGAVEYVVEDVGNAGALFLSVQLSEENNAETTLQVINYLTNKGFSLFVVYPECRILRFSIGDIVHLEYADTNVVDAFVEPAIKSLEDDIEEFLAESKGVRE